MTDDCAKRCFLDMVYLVHSQNYTAVNISIRHAYYAQQFYTINREHPWDPSSVCAINGSWRDSDIFVTAVNMWVAITSVNDFLPMQKQGTLNSMSHKQKGDLNIINGHNEYDDFKGKMKRYEKGLEMRIKCIKMPTFF